MMLLTRDDVRAVPCPYCRPLQDNGALSIVASGSESFTASQRCGDLLELAMAWILISSGAGGSQPSQEATLESLSPPSGIGRVLYAAERKSR